MWRYPNLPTRNLCVDGTVTAVRVFQARSFISRLFGLLGRRPLSAGEALWIQPCSSVHTVGMRYAIDVVFVDDSGRVLATHESLAPRRLAAARRARAALEMPSHSLAALGIVPGRRLTVEAA
jgi:uncharacterized protein